MERKRYLSQLVRAIQEKKSPDIISHIGNFAYDKQNHGFLLELQIIPLLISLLQENNLNIKDPILGTLCNLASNPKMVEFFDMKIIIDQWHLCSNHGQRSLSCILFYTKHGNPGFSSSDPVVRNILSCLD